MDIELQTAFQTAGKSIVLIGFMGVGKTSMGEALAALLGAELVDSDAEIEKQQKMIIGKIFEKYGEAHFRQLEKDFIADKLKSGHPIILSTGGGAFLNDEIRQIILDQSEAVWLQASKEEILKRTEADYAKGIVRPKIHRIVEDGLERETTLEERKNLIEELLTQRSPIYDECPRKINTESGTAKQNALTFANGVYRPSNP